MAITVCQGRQKCAVDHGDFVTKSGRHDCCFATMYFKSVCLHSGPIDEPVLAADAHVSIAGCGTCLEIDMEILSRMFLLLTCIPCNSNQADIILAAGGEVHSWSFHMVPYLVLTRQVHE